MSRLCLFCLTVFFLNACLPQPSDNNVISVDRETPLSTAAVNPNDTLLDSETHLILGPTGTLVMVLDSSNGCVRNPDFEVIIGSDEYTVTAKDATYEALTCYRKFTPTTTFEDHQVTVYDGPLASPDLDSHPLGRRYRTRIRQACSEGINFGGKYTLVSWGCGSPCQAGVLVDRITGKIVEGHSTNHGAEFYPNSTLLLADAAIVNEDKLFRMTASSNVQVRLWTGSGWEVLEQF